MHALYPGGLTPGFFFRAGDKALSYHFGRANFEGFGPKFVSHAGILKTIEMDYKLLWLF